MILQTFFVFLKLGLTSFGGPIAHLSFFHEEFVVRRKWLAEHTYLDLVALCQFLPGPASSQVGMGIGFSRAGVLGAIVAWIGFTLPSALILVLVALGVSQMEILPNWLHGLKIAAVVVVAHATWGMARKICTDVPRIAITALSAVMVTLIPSAYVQVFVLLIAAVLGMLALRPPQQQSKNSLSTTLSSKTAFICLVAFFLMLFTLPIFSQFTSAGPLTLFEIFYRAGSLVFGGGHVVLPLLQSELVPEWLSADKFMAGYGAAQAIPGPLFSFSAYIGATTTTALGVWGTALLCLLAAFLPSFLLVLGALPFWEHLRQHSSAQRALAGVNAAVVGLLAAALYHPVWTSAVFNYYDIAICVAGFLLLQFTRTPSWAIVLLSVAAYAF